MNLQKIPGTVAIANPERHVRKCAQNHIQVV